MVSQYATRRRFLLAVFISARDTVYVSSAHVRAAIDLEWDVEGIPLMNQRMCTAARKKDCISMKFRMCVVLLSA